MRLYLRTVCLLAALGVPCRAAGPGLLPAVQRILDAPEHRRSHWGVLAVDRNSGEVLQSHQEAKLFIPASTTKLFSVATALDAFGADFRFRTPVYRRGSIENGVLKGDLILQAVGDLTMGGRTTSEGKLAFENTDHTYEGFAGLTAPDPLAGLDELARQIADKGVLRVLGEVYVDDRMFDPETSSGSGPKRVTPILINDNVVDVAVKPTSPGQLAEVRWRPQTSLVTVDAQVETTAAEGRARIRIEREGRSRIVVRGVVPAPAGDAPVRETIRIVEVDDPATFARGLFIEALQRRGVRVDASRLADNPTTADLPRSFAEEDLLASLESPPFSENIRLILKVSHNLHASALPLLVAHKHRKRGLHSGLQIQRQFLERMGVDVESLSFGGGAGGSPADLVAPQAAVQLLRAMANRPDFAVYFEALPILGVDGTLADAVSAESPARGRVRAKTGTYWWNNALLDRKILTSKALAGYLTAASGREIVFALFVNYVHLDQPEDRLRVGRTLGEICEIWVQAY
jgi:D-alanyl-D-alanine carboxypeptidase/D-alanyl-D-alanine-endopeptidase (penicillin-binding protein 4)